MTKDDKKLAKERTQELMRNVQTGILLSNLRSEKKLSLADVGEKIGVSATYISDIEKGRKVPSDILIRELAKLYELDENELFGMYNKIPLAALEILENHGEFMKAVADVKTNREISDEQKEELLEAFVRLYKRTINDEN